MDARNDLTLSVTTPSDREIVLTRTFDAPRKPTERYETTGLTSPDALVTMTLS